MPTMINFPQVNSSFISPCSLSLSLSSSLPLNSQKIYTELNFTELESCYIVNNYICLQTNLHRLLQGHRRASQPPPPGYDRPTTEPSSLRPPPASFPEPDSTSTAALPSSAEVATNIEVQSTNGNETQAIVDPEPPTSESTAPGIEEIAIDVSETVPNVEEASPGGNEDPKDEEDTRIHSDTVLATRQSIAEEPGGIDNLAFTPEM
jgi:hypothetical protein